MTFISLQFLVFFILVTLLFFRMKRQKGRIWLLLIASCYFYMSLIPEYVLILGGIIVVDYFAGLQIEKSEGKARRFWLVVSIVANIGTLAVFKYYNFFIDNIHTSLLLFGKPISLPLLKMALPLGLSFHTFQAMSYTIEVYRGNQVAEKKFVVYALYVMFYPQLVAGPIERPQNILHQLKEFRAYNWENVKEGLARMLWGFFKKAVIADRLAMVVERTFGHSAESSSVALFTGAVFYSVQIYCDFSAYSDIAIGAAKVMNIRLMENFRQPLLSKSVSEFWRRWHISLYSWFYDYVFNPIMFYFRSSARVAIVFGILLIFLLSGLWHGAAWHFVVYGMILGIAIVIEYLTRKQRESVLSKMPKLISNGIGVSFTLIFIVLSFVFFRAESNSDAYTYLRGIFSFRGGSNYIGINRVEIIISVLLMAIMLLREYKLPSYQIKSNKLFYFYSIMMVATCYIFGVFTENQFIYFQF